jgi:APAF-1 helical domain
MNNSTNNSLEDAKYVLNLPYHLAMAGMTEEICLVLTDVEFLEHKIYTLSPQSLIDDYDLALYSDNQIDQEIRESLKLIQSAIDLSTNVLTNDSRQLAGQLWGRLLSFKQPEIKACLVAPADS